MPQRSAIKTKPAEWRRYFDRLLREDRWTLNELLEKMRERFPDEKTPSRSAAGRYSKAVKELAGRMRDIQAAGTALVAELGEDPNDRAGQMMVNAVTTLTTHAALQAQNAEHDLPIKEVTQLARGARAVLQARKMSLAERQAIAQEARTAALRESRAKVEALGKAGAIDPATLAAVIKAGYDL